MSTEDELNRSFYTKEESEDFDDAKQLKDGQDGKLDEETVVKNLSNLGRTADGSKIAYLSLSLPGFNLKDIKCLVKFKELQALELSYNQIEDLSVLSELPFLLSLFVSHNRIQKLFDFLPSYNLKEASFSFNQITEIGNLSNLHYLQTLELNHNKISKIEGLEYCHRLKTLNLAHNLIKKIEGLENLPLVNLDLIKKIEGLETLKFLRNLNLSGNLIKSLKGIPEKHEFLETIDLENNKISTLSEIDNLVGLNLLRDLNLHHNPLRETENYRLSVIFKIPKLTMLDRRKIDANEKVNADNTLNPSPEYLASRDHMTHLIFNVIHGQKVKLSTLPNMNSPYPILILCGAEGSGTVPVAKKLAEEYPNYFNYVPLNTTREPRPNEKDKEDFYFMERQEFEQDVTQGQFICCNEHFGDWFGIKWDSIENVAKDGLACVTQMELEALFSFKQTYFEPRCVLLITLDPNVQYNRLINQDLSEIECENALARTEWYAEYNREHPGFFDAVILTDDLTEGYENLKNLVLNYLGVSSQEQQQSIQNTQQTINLEIQRQMSILQSGRPKTNDEIKRIEEAFGKESKEYEMPRSDSFLPSNTLTGNRSQLSHVSMESLSQMYNQNLRLKFGSAPAQLLSKGEEAERSLEKRASAIKHQFYANNMVNVKSQLSHHLSKQAMQGTISSNSWTKWDDKSKSMGQSVEPFKSLPSKFGKHSPDSSDEEETVVDFKPSNNKNKKGLSRNSGRSSNVSSTEKFIEKFFIK